MNVYKKDIQFGMINRFIWVETIRPDIPSFCGQDQ